MLWIRARRACGVLLVFARDNGPSTKVAPARTSATRWGALTQRQRAWAASSSMNAIASPAVRLPDPFVWLVRSLTGANVDSMARS
jgi:hypothetical protein